MKEGPSSPDTGQRQGAGAACDGAGAAPHTGGADTKSGGYNLVSSLLNLTKSPVSQPPAQSRHRACVPRGPKHGAEVRCVCVCVRVPPGFPRGGEGVRGSDAAGQLARACGR